MKTIAKPALFAAFLGISTILLASCSVGNDGYRTPYGGMMGGRNGTDAPGGTGMMGGRGGMMGNAGANVGNSEKTGSDYDFDTGNLPESVKTPIVDLKDGDTYDLKVSAVRKLIAGKEVAMLAYNGSVPGPTLRVAKGASVKIRLTDTVKDYGTTLHSHGVRLDEAFDGVPVEQGGKTAVSADGKTVEYAIKFPDAGTFWYHPHVRDDVGQGMGLYGNYVVTDASAPSDSVNGEEYIVLSDVLVKNGKVAPFSKDRTDHALMGRYGNVLLTNGSEYYATKANEGDVVRFTLTNAASARTYRFGIDGAKLKLVGSDMGNYRKQSFVDSVTV